MLHRDYDCNENDDSGTANKSMLDECVRSRNVGMWLAIDRERKFLAVLRANRCITYTVCTYTLASTIFSAQSLTHVCVGKYLQCIII